MSSEHEPKKEKNDLSMIAAGVFLLGTITVGLLEGSQSGLVITLISIFALFLVWQLLKRSS